MISAHSRAKLQQTLRDMGFLWTLSRFLDYFGLPTFPLWSDRRVTSDQLSRQMAGILAAWGMSAEHRDITVKHMLYADIHGIDAHGCSLLPYYYRQLTGKTITMTPEVKVLRESETTALIDGGGGLGHVPAEAAMQLAIDKCTRTGLAVVTVRNSGHFGAAGSYAALAAEAGLIGLAMTSIKEPAMVPTGGRCARLGSNPIACAAPADHNPPFLLDMATSTAPMGKLVTRWREGRLLPASWALDNHGKTIRNPRRAILLRRLMPLGGREKAGGYKGYGLATMVELLSAVLPGQETGGVGHFFMTLDPGLFEESGTFNTRVDTLLDTLRATPPLASEHPVQVAGDPEYAIAAERRNKGIPLMRYVTEDICRLCRDCDVPFLLDSSS